MDLTGNNFLAGAGFADQNDRALACSDCVDILDNCAKSGRFTYENVLGIAARRARAFLPSFTSLSFP